MLASTSSVCGKTGRVLFTECDAADYPLAPYPARKRAAEILAHSYHYQFQINITYPRFFNAYGPIGRPMPIKVLKAVYANEPNTLFDDGRLSQDWTYVDDIIDGIGTPSWIFHH
jgi:UDP-glucuronate 4-epimerase